MPLLLIILIVIAIGVALWAFDKYITFIDPTYKSIVKIIAIVGTIIWLLKEFGIIDLLMSIKV